MNIRTRAVAATAATVAVLGLGAGSAAATGTGVRPDAAVCNNLGNSLLCIDWNSAGYNAELQKFQGGPVFVDFNLKCNNGRWFGDLGPFWASVRSQPWTYVFAVGSQGTCHVELHDGNTGAWIGNSPDLTR